MRIFPAVAALVLAACASSVTAPLNEEFTIGVGETADVSAAGLTVTFIAVTEDSRCPTRVQCVWAGNAQVQLQVRRDGPASTVVLNTLRGASEAVVGSYRVRLTALNPVPAEPGPTPAGAYRVSLKVESIS